MYLSTIDRPARGVLLRRRAVAVGANVIAPGAVSLVTDISSEMVTAVLPLYLILGLRLGPAVFGIVDGLYTGATALLRLVGGYLAGRVRRRKLIPARACVPRPATRSSHCPLPTVELWTS
jgi:hypothetical protein